MAWVLKRVYGAGTAAAWYVLGEVLRQLAENGRPCAPSLLLLFELYPKPLTAKPFCQIQGSSPSALYPKTLNPVRGKTGRARRRSSWATRAIP